MNSMCPPSYLFSCLTMNLLISPKCFQYCTFSKFRVCISMSIRLIRVAPEKILPFLLCFHSKPPQHLFPGALSSISSCHLQTLTSLALYLSDYLPSCKLKLRHQLSVRFTEVSSLSIQAHCSSFSSVWVEIVWMKTLWPGCYLR